MSVAMSVLPVFHAYTAALASGDLDALGRLFAEDIVWHQPGAGRFSGTYTGKSAVFGLLAAMAQHSNGSLSVQTVSAMENDDRIAAVVQFSASRGGERIDMQGVDVFRISDDRIAEVWLFSSDQPAEDAFWDR